MDITVKQLLYNLSKINSRINVGEPLKAIAMGAKLIEDFLILLGSKHLEFEAASDMNKKNLEIAINYLTENNKIPFSNEELSNLRENLKADNLNGNSLAEKANDQYMKIWNFYLKIQEFINEIPYAEKNIEET